MLFTDVVNAVLALDVSYFAWLATANIHWIFMFAAVMVFFQARKKHQLFYILMLVLMLYAIVDLAHLIGWGFPAALQIPVFVSMVVIATFENYKIVDKYKGILGIGMFWAFWIIFMLLGW